MGVNEAPERSVLASGTDSAEALDVEQQRKFRPDIYWYLSFRCNLACTHCSVSSSPGVDTSEDLSTEDCFAVVDQMAQLNVRTAILTGGEVLLRPDAIDIMARIGERGIVVGLESNGLLFTPRFVELARRLQERKLMTIAVSLDGGTPETHDVVRGQGSFNRTLRGLRYLNENGIRFSVQAILNRTNLRSVPELFRHATGLRPGLHALTFGFLNPVGRGKDLVQTAGLRHQDLVEIYGLIRRAKSGFDGDIVVKAPPAAIPPAYVGLVYSTEQVHGCTTCQFPLLGVLPNGDVTVCAVSRDNPDLYFGNVRTRSLKEMWLKGRMDMLRSQYVAAATLTGVCGDCIWQKVCKGSCRAWAYETGGAFDAPFPICQGMADEGTFPKTYRISEQRALGARASGKPAPGRVQLRVLP